MINSLATFPKEDYQKITYSPEKMPQPIVLNNWKKELPTIISNNVKEKPKDILPIILCGESGSGKDYVIKFLTKYYPANQWEKIELDSYYHGISAFIVRKLCQHSSYQINNRVFIEQATIAMRNIIRHHEHKNKFSDKNLDQILSEIQNLGLIIPDKNIAKLQLKALEKNIDFDKWDALDLDLAKKNLQTIIDGQDCQIPIYSMNESERQEKTKKISPQDKKIIFFEGLYSFMITEKTMRTLKLYIETPDIHKIFRRIIRDTHGVNPRKPYSSEESLHSILTKVIPNAKKNLTNQKKFANFILPNHLTSEEIDQRATNVPASTNRVGEHYFYDHELKQKSPFQRLTLTTNNNQPDQLIFQQLNQQLKPEKEYVLVNKFEIEYQKNLEQLIADLRLAGFIHQT